MELTYSLETVPSKERYFKVLFFSRFSPNSAAARGPEERTCCINKSPVIEFFQETYSPKLFNSRFKCWIEVLEPIMRAKCMPASSFRLHLDKSSDNIEEQLEMTIVLAIARTIMLLQDRATWEGV